MLKVEDFSSISFKHEYHSSDLNYDSFKKGKEWKILLFWGEGEDVIYEVPRVWIIFNGRTMFKGIIHSKEELELVYSLVNV